MDERVHSLSKLILSQDNQVWIMNLHGHPRFVDILTMENTGCSSEHVDALLCQALSSLVINQQELPDWDLHNLQSEHLVQTRLKDDSGTLSKSDRVPVTRIRGNRVNNLPVFQFNNGFVLSVYNLIDVRKKVDERK